MWAAWTSYLVAARDVLGLSLKPHEKFASWEKCAREGGFRILHEEFCIVSDFPVYIKKDEQNRPHCENGPSHLWRDGWALYFWHGVKVPKEWILDKKITPKEALTWENVEQRRAACEILGWAKIMDELNAKVIDRDDDPEVGCLLEADIPDSGKERFLDVRCGTGRRFVLPVPPHCKTALEASAWTYGLDGDIRNYIPEVRT
jgi:hypothetical protein